MISTVPNVLYYILPRNQNSGLLLGRGGVFSIQIEQRRGPRDLIVSQTDFPLFSFPPTYIEILAAVPEDSSG